MSSAPAQAVRFHLSLNVSELRKSVHFFKTLLGIEPAKFRDDYAKFELNDPPLVLSLEPHAPGGRGALNHAGFRFPDSAAFVDAQRRLELAGIQTQREEGVECCYSRQTKFWAHDPDGGLWEFYTLDEDIEHRGAGQAQDKIVPQTPAATPVEVWEHRLGQPFAANSEEESLGEVRLRGTFNAPHTVAEMTQVLQDAFQMLRPGGKLLVHVLTAEVPFPGELNLSGPAAHVKFVPVRQEVMAAVEEAGFTGLFLTKFGASPCFTQQGIEMRETMITGTKPVEKGAELRSVVYKGPFATVTDDAGSRFRRGEVSEISDAEWTVLSNTAIGEQFVCFPAPALVELA